MIILVINSDVDNFIINTIVLVTAIMFYLVWVRNKIKSMKNSKSLILTNNFKPNLNNYTFNFDKILIDNKVYNLKTKVASMIIAVIIIVIPLYDLIETLKPQEMFPVWSCFI